MGRIRLKHVRQYDDGNVGPESFTTGSAKLSQESCRLVGDLALLTRPFGDADAVVNFDEVECLADEAIELVIKRLDWMAGELGIAESPSGQLHLFPWFEDNDGLLRKPTRGELLNFEGESRLLWDALEPTNASAERSLRLLAAFGVFCCERALDAETRKHIGTIIELYSAAGVLLGHANYLLGCLTEKEIGADRYKLPLREGGRRRWQSHPTQKVKVAMHEEWQRWQRDRSKYAKPSDFRAKMLTAHGAVVNEGTVKNWMTEWRKSWKPSCS